MLLHSCEYVRMYARCTYIFPVHVVIAACKLFVCIVECRMLNNCCLSFSMPVHRYSVAVLNVIMLVSVKI